jgi:hypothetical protein
MTKKSTILPFRQKVKSLTEEGNLHIPSAGIIDKFTLPKEITLDSLKDIAETIALESLGIMVPHCRYPERFEEGFRYGLMQNQRTNIQEHFRPLFSKGFCWAKMFYRKFDPAHPLGAFGSFRMKAIIKE